MKRAIALSLVAWTVLLAVAFALRPGRPDLPVKASAPIARRDPDLARCQAAGEEAGRDPSCREAWRAARARFFGGRAS